MRLRKHWFQTLLLSMAMLSTASQAALMETNFTSKLIGQRGIHIYLPPSYDSQPQGRYPVLYLHDGQNVFSSAGTNCAFGWGNWELDLTADKLSRAGKMREVIMVAVDNGGFRRTEEYSGSHGGTNGTPPSAYEKYSRFLREELKPWADANLRTLPEAANTAVMGSSLGGLISLTLAWEHPEVFGNAASLSGAFQYDGTNFLNAELKNYRGQPKQFRVYLDSGVADFMGGDDGCALTKQVAAELQRIGWKQNLELFIDAKLLTLAELEKSGLRRDKWDEAQTSQHNEFYWRLRAWRALTFLFPPDNSHPN